MFETFGTISSAGTTLIIPDCELVYLRAADAFYLKQFMSAFMLPVIFVLCIAVWSLLYCCCHRRCKLKNYTVDYTILSIVLLSFLCYPTIVKITLSMLRCPWVGNQMYLMADMQEPCFVGPHLKYLMLLTIPQIVLYVIGLPVAGALHLMRNKENLHEKHFYTRYSLLYLGYRDDRAWWELVVAFRKVSVVAIGTFGTLLGVVDLQAHLALLIVFISIATHLVGKPYDTNNKNSRLLYDLELCALCICWLTFWGGLLFFLGHEKKNSVSEDVKVMVTVILMLANISFFVVAFGYFVKEYRKDSKKAKERKSSLNAAHLPVTVVPTIGTSEEDATAVSVAAAALSSSFRFANDDLDHEQHIDNVINEHHGHEERLNALHRKQSKRAKRNTQLRLLERSKIKSLKILSQVPGFSQMNEVKISKMVDNMKLIKFKPGDIICQEGDAADCFYVILEGNCAITSLRHGSRRMATIGEYDFFGESMMTTNEAFRTRGATVTVVPEDEENEDLKKKIKTWCASVGVGKKSI